MAAGAAFFGDMLHGWDWHCCAGQYPDLWSKFGGDRTFFDRRRKYRSRRHKVLDERECTCPLDFWRSKHHGDCADRKELTRLKAELHEEKQGKSKLEMEVASQRRKVDALKRKTENLQSQSMIAELEATRLREEVVVLKSKVDNLDKRLKAEKAQHASKTEEARQARLRLYSQLKTERFHAKEDKRAKLMLWSQLQAVKDAKAGLALERDAERRSAEIAIKDASLMKANHTSDVADLTAQLHEAKDQVQNLTASIAAQSHRPWATGQGYGEHAVAVVVIVILAVVCRVAGQASDTVAGQAAHFLDADPATAACSDCSRARVEEEADAVAATVDTDGGLRSELDVDMFDECSDSETLRFVSISCPGASQDDITVSTLFNGCAVAISYLEGPSWTKSFQFGPEDGCFQLEEQRVRFDQGTLLLVFRACPVPGRILQLPHDRAPEEQEDSTAEATQAVPLPDSDNGCGAPFDAVNEADSPGSDGTFNEHQLMEEILEPAGLDQDGSRTVEDDGADFWAADEEPAEVGTTATDHQAVPNLPLNDPLESPDSFEQISASDDDDGFEIIFHEGAEHRA